MNKILQIIILVVVGFGLYSCYDNPVSEKVANMAPTTKIALNPDDTISLQPSRVHVHWWGDDKDGLVVGYFFTWDNSHWSFTTKTDSLFALQIGSADTIYHFRVAAVDNSGNNKYDTAFVQNNINFGPEPFTDVNGNGKWDQGEPYTDLGLVDPNPASLPYPIKNTAPVIKWDTLTVIPSSSYPVMTFYWSATDADGDATIKNINIVLNDTTNSSNVVALNGTTRLVTLRTRDFTSANPETEILVNSSESSIFATKLKGIKLNDSNKVFIQAVDISGAKTPWSVMPKAGKSWYVKKPVGKLLIVDDYATSDNSSTFYATKFDALNGGVFKNKYDIIDIAASQIPFFKVNFVYTMKLWNYAFWYSDNNPSLDIAGASINVFTKAGGKVMFSMLFSRTPAPDIATLQEFLPIDSISALVPSVFANVAFNSQAGSQYPTLTTSTSVISLFGLYPTPLVTQNLYKSSGTQLPGYAGFYNTAKSVVFVGLPLHKMDGGTANVSSLLNQVFINDFGLSK